MEIEMTWRLALAAANAIVATLNWRAYASSMKPVDLWAAIAWTGSTSFWIWSLQLCQ
jgi:hypothetical protein